MSGKGALIIVGIVLALYGMLLFSLVFTAWGWIWDKIHWKMLDLFINRRKRKK